MAPPLSKFLLHLALVLPLIFPLGCSTSKPSKFYSLAPIGTEKASQRGPSSKSAINIAVGPIRLPDYLDRPQIVTRSGKNELTIAEFNRWGGSLDNNINQVLVENLTIMLPGNDFFVTRWTPSLASELTALYHVEVVIERFEGDLGDAVILKGQWTITGNGMPLPITQQVQLTEKVKGRDYNDLVTAMSRAVEGLSRAIADTTRSLPASQ